MSSKADKYSRVRGQTSTAEEHYATTTARMKQLQSHLDTAVRAGKLQDKVCIVTGVGSLKGIGYVSNL